MYSAVLLAGLSMRSMRLWELTLAYTVTDLITTPIGFAGHFFRTHSSKKQHRSQDRESTTWELFKLLLCLHALGRLTTLRAASELG